MKTVLKLYLAVVVAIGLACAAGIALGENVVLKAAGCKTEYFLFKDIAEAFNKQTGNKVLPGGVGNKKAINLLMNKQVDFAFTCRPIEKLTKKLKLNPADVVGWKSIPIAMDPIVVVSNAENGVHTLTTDQLIQVFSGKIKNWKEIGGNDLPVRTAYLDPKLESGIVLLFKEFTVGNNGQLDPNAQTADGPSLLGNYVTQTPGSVTFMGFNSYKKSYGDIVSIDGVAPTRENIMSLSYGLAAIYYMTLDARENHAVSNLMNFIKSDTGKQSIDQNFIAY